MGFETGVHGRASLGERAATRRQKEKGEEKAYLRRQEPKEHGQLPALVDRASIGSDGELRVAGRGKLAGPEEQHRIAQLVVAPVVRVEWDDVGTAGLPATARQDGGFGHTGVAPKKGGEDVAATRA